MKKSFVITAALLTGTMAGSAFASSHTDEGRVRLDHGRKEMRSEESDRGTFRVAGDHDRDRDRHKERKHRRHHDDDDDDDDDRDERGGRAGRMPTTGPSDPATPVPDNGLLQGKVRPKVEVN